MKFKRKILLALIFGLFSLVPTIACADNSSTHNKNSSIEIIDKAIFEKYPDAKNWVWDDKPSDIVYEIAEEGSSPFQMGAVLVTADALGSSLGSLGHAAISFNNSKNVSSYISNGVR